MTHPEAPQIDRIETGAGYTVRLRAKSAHTQRDGWRPADITVEYDGPPDCLPAHIFTDRTVSLYDEIDEACRRMNQIEGR